MGKQFIKPIVFSLSLVISFSQVAPVYSCGPFLPNTVFSYPRNPDLPLRKFAQGELGILQPTLAKSYLVVAYRYLTNRPLDGLEQNAVLNLWHDRLNCVSDGDASAEWLATRNTVPGIEKLKTVDIYANQSGSFQSYENCSRSAFQTAAKTVKARIAKYGISSKEVKLWVQNQDKVFSNCGGERTGS